MTRRQRVAIVGTGISGMLTARMLAPFHDLTIYEAGATIGGHTNTVDVEWAGRSYAIDTGFIVFNHRTYPHFTELLEHLDVPAQDSAMSFSVSCARTGVEYNGTSLNTLFAQRRNLFRPSFHGMIRDILRFNREAQALLAAGDDGGNLSLGEYLDAGGYGRAFVEHYIVPMGGAIWSAGDEAVRRFPARAFLRFFDNHGMLSVDDRPMWRVVQGGSREYVKALVRPFEDRIRLQTPVWSVRRDEAGVALGLADGSTERHDAVVLACHSDQALRMLADPSRAEREILSAIPYQPNEAVLHVDDSVLPRTKRAWAAWNVHLSEQARAHVAVTYDMNILQGLDAPVTFNVTLNDDGRIDPSKVLQRISYHHPVFDRAGFAAQKRFGEISGVRGTYYCGAWWGWGFHEDGVNSALAVARQFGIEGIPPRRVAEVAIAPEPVLVG